MATGMYAKGLEHFLKGDISWDSDDIKVVLIDAADYTVDLAADEALDDVTGAGRVSTSGNLSGKTVTGGVADASDATLSTVTGDQAEALVVYKDSGVEATSYLICYIDNYTGLPVTPNGSNITIAFPNDSNKIFKL
jgi:hypothetical protein